MTTPRELADRLEIMAEHSGELSYYVVKAALEESATTIRTLADQQERDAWQPIETAPKDGTRVLAGHFTGRGGDKDGYMVVDYWRKDGYSEGFLKFNLENWPATHWMPLPAPPDAARAQEPKT